MIRAPLLATLVAWGCGSSSFTVTNTIPNAIFDPHTVFGWIQTEQFDTSSETYKALTPSPLAIVVSGASFSPTQDLRTVSSTLPGISTANGENGYLQLWFSDVSKLATGMAYTTQFGSTSNPDSPFQFNFLLGYTPLTDSTQPPSNPPYWGSEQTLTVTFQSLGQAVGDTFACTVVWSVQPFDGDPADAVSGKMTITVSGQLVNEELGACDASLTDPFWSGPADCNDGFFQYPVAN